MSGTSIFMNNLIKPIDWETGDLGCIQSSFTAVTGTMAEQHEIAPKMDRGIAVPTTRVIFQCLYVVPCIPFIPGYGNVIGCSFMIFGIVIPNQQ